jgi:hypothetical protein
MLGVNRSSHLSAVGDPNPLNQALYLVADLPCKESCSNLRAADRGRRPISVAALLKSSPIKLAFVKRPELLLGSQFAQRVDCFAPGSFSDRRESDRDDREGVNGLQVLLPGQ